MTERAQRMQAFAGRLQALYEALSEEQKAVAGIVPEDMRGAACAARSPLGDGAPHAPRVPVARVRLALSSRRVSRYRDGA